MEHGRIHGGERGTGGGREKGETEKKYRKIIQQCLLLGNGKRAKGRKPRKKKGLLKKVFEIYSTIFSTLILG